MIFEDTVSEYNFLKVGVDYIVININNKDWDELTVMKYQPMPIQFTKLLRYNLAHNRHCRIRQFVTQSIK